jgi:hypothetical protein
LGLIDAKWFDWEFYYFICSTFSRPKKLNTMLMIQIMIFIVNSNFKEVDFFASSGVKFKFISDLLFTDAFHLWIAIRERLRAQEPSICQITIIAEERAHSKWMNVILKIQKGTTAIWYYIFYKTFSYWINSLDKLQWI